MSEYFTLKMRDGSDFKVEITTQLLHNVSLIGSRAVTIHSGKSAGSVKLIIGPDGTKYYSV